MHKRTDGYQRIDHCALANLFIVLLSGYIATIPSMTKVIAYMKATRGKSPPLRNYWAFLEICVMGQFLPHQKTFKSAKLDNRSFEIKNESKNS